MLPESHFVKIDVLFFWGAVNTNRSKVDYWRGVLVRNEAHAQTR